MNDKPTSLATRLLNLAHRVDNPAAVAEIQALAVEIASIIEIDGVSWCVTHGGICHGSDTYCAASYLITNRGSPFCVTVPLYRGGAA